MVGGGDGAAEEDGRLAAAIAASLGDAGTASAPAPASVPPAVRRIDYDDDDDEEVAKAIAMSLVGGAVASQPAAALQL